MALAGLPLDSNLARAGREVLVVERDRVGGTCLNVGCIPSKALLHVADAAALPDQADRWGLKMSAHVDMEAVQGWMADVVAKLSTGLGTSLRQSGVEVVHGALRFVSPTERLSSGPQAQNLSTSILQCLRSAPDQ